jgi:GTP-binding protein
MVVGSTKKEQDIKINVTKGKQLTNMRSKGSDGVIQLAPPVSLSLEQSLDYLEPDELLEITPESLRLRKRELNKS